MPTPTKHPTTPAPVRHLMDAGSIDMARDLWAVYRSGELREWIAVVDRFLALKGAADHVETMRHYRARDHRTPGELDDVISLVAADLADRIMAAETEWSRFCYASPELDRIFKSAPIQPWEGKAPKPPAHQAEAERQGIHIERSPAARISEPPPLRGRQEYHCAACVDTESPWHAAGYDCPRARAAELAQEDRAAAEITAYEIAEAPLSPDERDLVDERHRQGCAEGVHFEDDAYDYAADDQAYDAERETKCR